MKTIYKYIVLTIAISALYKNRYRLLNYLLRNPSIRAYAIKLSMNVPGLRSLFIRNTFQ
ncbi:hypothetical protein [Bacillus coahuilensis]|uniref:hypothetical protein n=1 Tax=Bacillus coahuilensis TaxID=408580 RepID=UPI0001851073|nr:hypothetical protein [Bacillus coahuilensis]